MHAPRISGQKQGHQVLNRRACGRGVLAFVLFLLLQCKPVFAESEYAVKAAYIYNFTTLVKWPNAAFSNAEAPMVIGIVGNDPFNGGLESVLKGRKAGARPLEIKRVRAGDTAGLRSCNLVFVADASSEPDVLTAVKGHPVLVVGEAANFASKGGAIGFTMKNQKIKLEINRAAARQSQLTIPSDLLAIATLVN